MSILMDVEIFWLTSYVELRSILQLGEHAVESIDSLIKALCGMKSSMLQLISNIRRRLKFDDLCITMSISHTK